MLLSTSSTRLALALVSIALALAMGLTTVLTLVSSYVPLMYWDQWETASMYAALEAGTWRSEDWLKLHNEHRIVFPRLVYLADLAWAGGSDLLNLGSLMLLQLGHGYLLYRLLISGASTPAVPRLAVGALVMAAMVTLSQVSNLRWGFQVAFVAVYAAASGAIVATVLARKSHWIWTGAAIALALAATFCMANGLLVWPVMMGVALLSGAGRMVLLSISVAAVAAGTVYLTGYATPAHHAPPLASLQQPDQLLMYLVTYLGNPLQSLGAPVARTLGAASLAFAVVTGIQLGREKKPPQTQIALVAIVSFVILSGSMTAVGRLGFGVDQAWVGRYATPAMIYWLAILGLVSARVGRTGVGLTCVLIAAGSLTAASVLAQVSEYNDRYEYLNLKTPAHTAMMVGVEDQKAFSRVSSLPWSELQPRVDALRQLQKKPFSGMPAMLLGRSLDEIITGPLESCEGELTSVQPVSAGGASAFGWVWHTASASTPRWIILVDTATQTIIGLGRSGFPRPHVTRHFSHINDPRTGWYGHVQEAEGPLQAFGLLGSGSAGCRLKSLAAVP